MKPAVESFWENRGQASRKLVWMALLAILGTETVWSGTKEWTGLGPEGKTVEALAIVPQDPQPIICRDEWRRGIQEHGWGSELDSGEFRSGEYCRPQPCD